MDYEVDAKDRSMGRVATEVAMILRGKNTPEFQPNIAPKVQVKVKNISEVKLTGNKMKEKVYKTYSGHPGGQKTITFKKIFDRNPEEAFKKVVRGMLPKNKLRKEMLKNLSVE